MEASPPRALAGGRLEVRGTLGTGGAGTVYRAFDSQLQREVAVKVLRQASGRDLYRFKREFRALADIVHPNLVTLHELFETDGAWFFTMELVEGVCFVDWVRPPRVTAGPLRTREDIAASPVSEMRLRGAMVQLVDGLIALHKAGKLHRDLKPSNVLVTAQGRVALLDFGLVATVAEDNPERLAVGTPLYMSPEQAADLTLTEASDWYSLGAMLYEALTGVRPFEGEPADVMRRKQHEEPVPPHKRTPGVSPELSRLCMQLLHPMPTGRPAGVAILQQLGAAPSRRTRDIARSVLPQSFIGRARELEELRRAFSESRRRTVGVFVRGVSGMGKTTLVRKFMRSLGEQVFAIEGRCFEREQVPFKMLDGLVDALTGVLLVLSPGELDALAPKDVGALVRLFPVMKRVRRFAELAEAAPPPPDPAELRRRGFHALRGALAKLSKIRPVVLFVDDAHWGDIDSVGFFTELIHNPEGALLVLLAHRPEDYLGVVAKLRQPPPGSARRGDLREVELGPLPDVEAISLVAQLATDSGRAEIVVRAAGGNPLVLAEMARAPQLEEGTTIDELVHARTARCSPEAAAMLAVSSVAARPIPVEIAARAVGLVGGHDEASQLATERLAMLRRVDGKTILQPAHDHVRAAVLETLRLEEKASWHEALARAFEDVQGDAELDAQAVVEHWLAAGHPADAARHAITAAARAEEALAFLRAAEMYELAVNHGPWDAAGRRDLLRKQGNALACAGRLEEAAQIYEHAASLIADDDALDLERLRIEALLRRGLIDEALPIAEKLLEQIGVKSPLAASRTRLAAQWMQAKFRGLEFNERAAADVRPSVLRRIDVLYSIVSGLAFADPALGRVLQAELIRAALDCGEPTRVCLALAQELCYTAAAGGTRSWNTCEQVGTRLTALATRVGHPHLVGLAETANGVACHLAGRWREARAHLEAGLVTLGDHGAGVRWELDIGESYWLSTLFYLGEWRELLHQAQTLLHDALERGDVVAQLGVRTGRCNLAWLIAGRPDAARAQLDAAERSLPSGFHLPHVRAMQAAASIDLYCGDAAGAVRRVEAAWPEMERIGILRMQSMRVEMLILRARATLSDQTQPLAARAKLVRTVSEELIKEGAPWAVGLGLLARASALAATDDFETAIATLHAAEEQLAATGMAGWMEIAKLRRGTLEGGPGGAARAEAARDALADRGAADPDRIADLLVPWPS